MNSSLRNIVINYQKKIESLEEYSLLKCSEAILYKTSIILYFHKNKLWNKLFILKYILFLLHFSYDLRINKLYKIVDVLTARDAICEKVKVTNLDYSEDLILIYHLDTRLKSKLKYIANSQYFSEVRDIKNPSTEAWWWSIDNNTFWIKYDWIWRSLNLPLSAINIALAIDISTRFLGAFSELPNFLGIIAFSIPNILAVIATGSTLTQAGRNMINDFLLGLKIPKLYWEELKLLLTLIILITLFYMKLSLPVFAVYFNNEGVNDIRKGNLESAISNYELAIKLNPGYPEANYGLGMAYEIMQNKENALKYYTISALNGMSTAYSQLGRLQILDKKYPEAAVFLVKGKKLLEEDIKNIYPKINKSNFHKNKYKTLQRTKYQFLRNLGWVRLELGQLEQARNYLSEATNLNPELPTAHCIMALVLEKEDNNKAIKEWDKCYTKYLDTTNKLKDISTELESWSAIAEQKLKKVDERNNEKITN